MLEWAESVVWFVPDKGFALDGDYFRVSKDSGGMNVFVTHDLQDYEQMFLKCRDISTPEQLIEFVNDVGMISDGNINTVTDKSYKWPIQPIIDFSAEIKFLSSLIALSEENNRRELGKIITWNLDSVSYQFNGETHKLRYDIKDPTYKKVINAILEERITAKISNVLRYRFEADARGDMKILVYPTNLFSCIWLYFAEHIQAGNRYRFCKNCRKLFTPKAKRKMEHVFCEDKCRVQHSRKMKNERSSEKKK